MTITFWSKISYRYFWGINGINNGILESIINIPHNKILFNNITFDILVNMGYVLEVYLININYFHIINY